MKNTIITLALVSMTITSFKTHPGKLSGVDAEKFAGQVTNAFRHGSFEEFTILFPSLNDFHTAMQSSNAYGDFLEDAQKDFFNTYHDQLIPSLKESFEEVLADGRKKGIDWENIRITKTEAPEFAKATFGSGIMAIHFESRGKAHSLIIEKALVVNGQWKVSQYLRLK